MKRPAGFSRTVLVLGLLAWSQSPGRAAEGPATTPLPPVAAPAPAAASLAAPVYSIRRATRTGHLSNYDEAKVGPYVLPDPLVLHNGQPVRDAATWYDERRPELLELYRNFIYGRVPAGAPRVAFTMTETMPVDPNPAPVIQHIVGQFGTSPGDPKVNVTLYLPANPKGPVPVFLHLIFGSIPRPPPAPGTMPAGGAAATPPRSRPLINELGPIADILARGYGYATVRYSEIEPDQAWDAPNRPLGVRALALAAGQKEPAADEWGTVSAWAWGISRIIDYFETDPAVDGRKVVLIGHSRLGKAAIWAGAQDPRFAMVFSSCAGELGTSLARRDFGETVDDMTQNFPWQFAGNLQQFPGHWNEMPVDTHLVIALNAPHPVFMTGGTTDQWSDPRGEFLAEVAAGPVYRLVGKKDLGTTQLPVDTPLLTGDLGFNYHTGGHMIAPSDWQAFLAFADKYLK